MSGLCTPFASLHIVEFKLLRVSIHHSRPAWMSKLILKKQPGLEEIGSNPRSIKATLLLAFGLGFETTLLNLATVAAHRESQRCFQTRLRHPGHPSNLMCLQSADETLTHLIHLLPAPMHSQPLSQRTFSTSIQMFLELACP